MPTTMAVQRVALDTTYQVTPLRLSTGINAHRMSVTVTSEGAIHVVMDTNSCQLDAFGSPTACTLMAPFTYDGRLLLLDERRGEWLFSVEAPDAPALQIVLRSLGETTDARLLVLDASHTITAVVALGRRPSV